MKSIFFKHSFYKYLFIIVCYYLISKIINKKQYKAFYDKHINSDNVNFTSSLQFNNNNIIFNLLSINYFFSYFYNQVELEYCFYFSDQENNLIFPSDLSLYYNLHIFCIFKSKNFYLQSLGDIHQNNYFCCLEYYKMKSTNQFEVKICKDSSKCTSINMLENYQFNYNNLKLLNDTKFNCSNINEQHLLLTQKVFKSDKINLLEKTYISQPVCSDKTNYIANKNIWYFININNHYFCFCNGIKCPFNKNFDDCKYYFYLSIINNNKNLYTKSNYLLADFLYANRAPGDAYFIFREMIKQNLPAFYLTERKDIYKEYFDKKIKFQKIIPIVNKQYKITGYILEKYLTLFLKLKSVISGSEFFSKVNIFKVIDYITFICLGHGVNYFKPFLYKDYYGCKRYDKIILPSDKVISIAKKYGWEQKNIIKMGLPKWDLFYSYSLSKEYQKREKCIFMMFTWRKLKKRKKISPNYFNNIKRILKDSKLKTILNKKNVTLYASLHHNLLKNRNLIKRKIIAKYIKQEDIFSCLMKCDLIISDFSSVIFDLMYRNKPFIIFIPDSDDKNLFKRYDKDYINIINGFKNNSTKFENIFLNTKDTINKIIYYIENDFYLDSTLETLYKQFDLNHKNNINNFIKYLKSL